MDFLDNILSVREVSQDIARNNRETTYSSRSDVFGQASANTSPDDKSVFLPLCIAVVVFFHTFIEGKTRSVIFPNAVRDSASIVERRPEVGAVDFIEAQASLSSPQVGVNENRLDLIRVTALVCEEETSAKNNTGYSHGQKCSYLRTGSNTTRSDDRGTVGESGKYSWDEVEQRRGNRTSVTTSLVS